MSGGIDLAIDVRDVAVEARGTVFGRDGLLLNISLELQALYELCRVCVKPSGTCVVGRRAQLLRLLDLDCVGAGLRHPGIDPLPGVGARAVLRDIRVHLVFGGAGQRGDGWDAERGDGGG
jgi:hypothetical protein